ncbi:MAG: DNA repair protein RecO [Prevotella sp.]|nr:DNA repair protein RecO [Prevotella sp.]
MQTKTRAIVLRTLKYGESQLIIDLLTEQQGRLSFIQHIGKTQKARVRKQLFQPLTLIDVAFDYRPKSSLQHMRDVRISTPFTTIPLDAAKLSVSLFLAEFIYYCTHDEQQNAPLYRYCENGIRWLDGAQAGFANFHLVFMMRLSRFIGFYPNLDDYSEGCFFDLRAAAFTPVQPLHPDFLKPDEAAHITTLMRMDYETMRLFRLTRQERNRITDCLVAYYRHHVPGFPEPRSLAVVREIFA